LRPEPVAAIYDEYLKLALLTDHIFSMNMTIYVSLKRDRHAKKVRAAFWPFIQYMDLAMRTEFGKGLSLARDFYTNDKLNPSPIPIELEEPALIFQDAEFQARLIDYAHRASSHFGTAAQIIREKVLPLLPYLTEELRTFVDECLTLKRITEARAKSWIPSRVQDLVWGKNEEITCNISDIEVLLEDIQVGETFLRKIPAILESLSTHFLQLSKLKRRDLDAMGYPSLWALRSLLEDRTACLNLFGGMIHIWIVDIDAIGIAKFAYPISSTNPL
jgi:hypothetical protein